MNGSMKAVVASGIKSMSLSLMAAQPRMLDPSMPKPSVKDAFRQFADGIRNVVLQPRDIGEPHINLARAVFLRVLKHFTGCHENLRSSLTRAGRPPARSC